MMKNVLLVILSCIIIFILAIGFMWHHDNFVYLPSVSTAEYTNDVVTLHMHNGDTYVIEVSDNTF